MPFRYGWRARSRRSILLLALLGAACGGGDNSRPVVVENSPPVVTGVFFNRPRAHTSENLVVSAGAEDADADPLTFRWRATRGTFPLGLGLRTVTWRSPDTLGTDTLTVTVTDGQDTVRYRVEVELVLPEPPGTLTPTNSTNLADLRWEKSPDEGIEAWSGYEVYGAEQSLAQVPVEELAPFLLTPEPITERAFRVFGLTQGTKYFFHLRSVRQMVDVTERSVFAQEVDLAPRPEGYQLGFGEFTSDLRIAFDLSEHRPRSLDPDDVTGVAERDFYLGTIDPLDQSGALMLKSVSLLANRNPAWGEREVLIKPIGLDWTVATVTDDGWSTQAAVQAQSVYAVKTPEGNFAKIRVTGIQGFPPNRAISLQWAYQPIPGYANF